MHRISEMAKEPSRGIFWVIDDELFSFPFTEDGLILSGMAKSGLTYNHKLLWDELNSRNKKMPYNYYPRGRVEFDNKGNPIVYMNPNISFSSISADIKKDFCLREEPKIHYDYSDHYKCYLDDGWKPDR